MITYAECKLLGAHKLENNTHLVNLAGGDFGVKLHNTVIVEVRQDGTYKLTSGGYRTATTKDRLNKYGPLGIWQHKGEWYYKDEEGNQQTFEDGILV